MIYQNNNKSLKCWEYMHCPEKIRKKCWAYRLNLSKECWILRYKSQKKFKWYNIKGCNNCKFFIYINAKLSKNL